MRCDYGRKAQRNATLLALRIEEGGPRAKECGWPLEAWKGQGKRFFLRGFRKECIAADTLNLAL